MSRSLRRLISKKEGLNVRFQLLAHGHDIIHGETDPFMERDDVGVGGSDLKVDFRTPQVSQSGFSFLHHATPNAPAPEVWRYGQVIDPSTVPFKTGHDRGANLTALQADEKQIGLKVHIRQMPCNAGKMFYTSMDFGPVFNANA